MAASTNYSSRWNIKVSSSKRYFKRSGRSSLFILGWICAGLLLIAVVVAGIWWLCWPKDTVTASIRIAASEPCLLSSIANKYAPDEFEIYKNTQKELLTNPLVLNAALQNPKCSELQSRKNEPDLAGWLKSKLRITFPEHSEIMQVSLSGANREELVILVNAVADAYIANVVDAERNLLDERISKLKNIQFEETQKLKDSLNEMRRMAASLGTSETETLNVKQKNMLDELANVRSESIRSQFDLNRANAELASLKALKEATENQPITDIEVQMQMGNSDPILQDLRWQLVQEKQASESMQGLIASSSKSRSVQKDVGNMFRIQQQYAERLDTLRKGLASKNIADVDKEIKKLEAQIEVMKKQNDVTIQELMELRKETDRIGTSSIEMQMRRADNASAQKFLDSITTELEKLNMEKKSAPRVSKLMKEVE